VLCYEKSTKNKNKELVHGHDYFWKRLGVMGYLFGSSKKVLVT
jgi:hypothetical protein